MHKNLIATALLLASFLAALLFVSWFINDLTEQSGFRVLRQATLQLCKEIHDRVMGDQDQLRALAALVGREGNPASRGIETILADYETRGLVSSLEILLPGDEVLLKNGNRRSVAGLLSFGEELRKAPYVSNVETALDGSGKKVLRNCVPILQNGTPTALLMGVIGLDRLPGLFESRAFGTVCQIYIMAGDSGDFILDTWHKTPGNSNALGGRQAKAGYDWARMRKDLAEGRPGNIVFLSRTVGEYFYLHYEPLGINTWSVMLSIPESVLFQDAKRIKTALILLISGVLAACGAFFGWAVFNARRETKEKEAQLHLTRQALDMEKTLSSAHRNPDHIWKGLSTVADMLTAESTCFLIFKNGQADQSWNFRKDALNEQNCMPLHAAMELPALRALLAEQKSLLLDPVGTARKLPPHESEELRRMGLHNLMLALVEEPKGALTGLLAAANMRRRWKDTERLQIAALSFATALSNIDTHLAIKKMSEFDALTGLLNRNCFENSLPEYQTRGFQSLGCVYVDANGLHELNNTHGHEAGDRMLQGIASVLRAEFGRDNAYRIGGDEFVAFVIDADRETLPRKVRAVEKAAKGKQYHCAMGTAWSPAPFSAYGLIKTAERNMYASKQRYYSGKTDRRKART